MTQPVNIVTYETECILCGKKLQFAALSIPVVGQPGDQELAYMAKLLKHVATKHREEFKQGVQLLQMFQTFLVLAQFRTKDPNVNKIFETWRAQIFSLVRKNTLTDASLLHVIAGFGLDKEVADQFFGAMKEIRDACCELGRYSPDGQTTAPSPLVTV